ncbi:MAG: hypothetical protein PW843_03025 [Azospirillaceae bacterium]|nr:hypothetical protein [Azospirillaceae bacterium]
MHRFLLRRFWLVLLLAVMAIGPARAQTYQDRAWQRVDAATLAFRGQIQPRRFLPTEHPVSDAVLLARNLTPETRTLVLSSGGGDVAVALAMARMIHERRLNVVVDGRCASACAVLLFLAGDQKAVRPGAVLEFHSTNSLDPRDTPDAHLRLTREMQAIQGRLPDLARDGVAVAPPDLGGATVDAILAARRQNAAQLRDDIAALYQDLGVDAALLGDIDRAADAYLADHPDLTRDQVWWCLSPRLLADRYHVTGLGDVWMPDTADALTQAAERFITGGMHLIRDHW